MRGGIAYRLAGLVCIAIAGAAGWWGIWQPWQAALAHEPQVHYSLKVFVLVPVAAVFGLFFLIFGDSVPYRNPEKQSFTAAGWLLMLAVLLASGVTFWWFKAQFDALGYAY
jgi:hypothetical protein